MSRFLAVTTEAKMNEAKFRKAFDRTGKWRYGKRAWVIKSYWCGKSGRLVIESEAPDQETFEDWLNKNDLTVQEIDRVDLIQEAGLVWPMRF
jgi:hypothetical protein